MQVSETTTDGPATAAPIVVLIAEWYALGALLEVVEDELKQLRDAPTA